MKKFETPPREKFLDRELNCLPDIVRVDEFVVEFGRFVMRLEKMISDWNN